MSTEGDLRDWRFGQVQAERLAAAIFAIEGFTDIDPQAPLGGRDGQKDILATRDGARWVGAVYFPTLPKDEAGVKAKLVSDYPGVARHGAHGLVFVVNQHLNPGARDRLAKAVQGPLEIYHLERLRHILDTPLGYGARLQYLRIEMSLEEQLGYFNALEQRLVEYLATVRSTTHSARVSTDLAEAISTVGRTVASMASHVHLGPSTISTALNVLGPTPRTPMGSLTVAQIVLLHRALTESTVVDRGAFRAIQVWIGGADAITLPAPDEVPGLLGDLVNWWRSNYDALTRAAPAAVIEALTKLHYEFLAIHPFLDGNGRVARTLTDLAAQELLGRRLGGELTADAGTYYAALAAANGGDLDALTKLMTQALA